MTLGTNDPGLPTLTDAPRHGEPPWTTRVLATARHPWQSIRARPEVVLTPLVFVVFVVVWHLVSTSGLVSPIILPSPIVVAGALVTLLGASYFPLNLGVTAFEMVTGFVIASASACAFAVILDRFGLLRRVLYPYLVTLQVMPMIVLAPVIVIWFGFGVQSKVIVAITTAFFVVLVTTLAGLASVQPNSLLLMRSLVASDRQTFTMLTLPTALPYIFAGLKTGSTLALIGALVGEFVTAEEGLGRLLTQFSFALKQDSVFATVIVVGALGLALYGTVAALERRIVWWRR